MCAQLDLLSDPGRYTVTRRDTTNDLGRHTVIRNTIKRMFKTKYKRLKSITNYEVDDMISHCALVGGRYCNGSVFESGVLLLL